MALLLAAAVVLLAHGGASAAGPDDRPNIIVILVDDMGYSDLGCYGAEVIETPHIDRLAEEGLRFTRFYNNAKCSQTRASLLTGLWWQQTDLLRRRDNATMAEVLGEAGYTTLMAGKWHLGRWGQKQITPLDRGFEKFFGFLGGAINFYTGEDFGSGKNLMRLNGKTYQPPDDFYSTDAFTDYAVRFIDDALDKDRPFFLYLAHNAPHFPLHAPQEEIEKYRGKFMRGWDKLRRQRRQNMIEMGLAEPGWAMPPRDPKAPAWESLSKQDRRQEDQLMATYAAMMDRLDQNIGRLMKHLRRRGVEQNTLVMFLSDNGACPYAFNRTPRKPAGPADSMRTYDCEWAQASNTPLRLYKQWAHEGGAATPMIAHWPETIEPGTRTDRLGHLVDLMPTVLDLAGVEYPERMHGEDLLPLAGESLAPTLRGNGGDRDKPLFWEFRGHHAVRNGPWKLVAEVGNPWELYRLPGDRTEMNNLIDQHPERVQKLAERYDAWAERVGAPRHAELKDRPEAKQKRYLAPEADDPK